MIIGCAIVHQGLILFLMRVTKNVLIASKVVVIIMEQICFALLVIMIYLALLVTYANKAIFTLKTHAISKKRRMIVSTKMTCLSAYIAQLTTFWMKKFAIKFVSFHSA